MDATAYSVRVMGPAHVEDVVEQACRTALAYRQPTHVMIPVDFQSQPAKDRSERNVAHHVSNIMARGGQLPDPEMLQRAADILNQAEKPFILAGRGCDRRDRGTARHRRAAAGADRQAAARQAGGARPEPLHDRRRRTARHQAEPGGARKLRHLADRRVELPLHRILSRSRARRKASRSSSIPKRVGLRYPVDVGLVGDSKRVLSELLPLIRKNDSGKFLEAGAGRDEGMARADDRARARGTDTPMKPQVVTHELNKLLDDDAIVITDSGTITSWTARHVDMRGDMMFSCSGTLASMACGLPYAIGAATAFPDRQVVAVIGDGSAAMLMGDFVTLRKYNLNAKIIVIKNNALGQIKWEQMVFLGNPEYGCELEPIEFGDIARGCGINTVKIDDPARCGEQLREALATPGPCLIEAVVDPYEPPFPPSIEMKQALQHGARRSPRARRTR